MTFRDLNDIAEEVARDQRLEASFARETVDYPPAYGRATIRPYRPDLVANRNCYECRTNNHQACTGASWHTYLDCPAACPCWTNNHTETA